MGVHPLRIGGSLLLHITSSQASAEPLLVIGVDGNATMTLHQPTMADVILAPRRQQ